jgi:uncharacterized protein
MNNRLAQSTSPYLQQHATNPVWWHEWDEVAFAKAEELDRPIFLSIGYSACHWCHVMAHESFEDDKVADFLNQNFVCIKVDREERPDVDSIYMQATVAMTGHGGWPMSVFLDTALRPFYAGTYFPPTPRSGQVSFGQLLAAITDTWINRRDELNKAAEKISEHLAELNLPLAEETDFDQNTADQALAKLIRSFDPINHGFGASPKFPPSMALEFLLRNFARTKNADVLQLAEFTCYSMSRGGMYDQLGGGFARYSVDESWTIPHFEKMLYDNALLLGVYARLYRINKKPYFKRIVIETINWLQEEMLTEQSAFAAALDADTKSGEGIYYCWSKSEIEKLLDPAEAKFAIDQFGVTEAGTFEHGLSVLQRRKEPINPQMYEIVRQKLREVRKLREKPARDDKVIVSWNSWLISNLIDAAGIFQEQKWTQLAKEALDFLLETHLQENNLYRVSRDGKTNQIPALLEDWASLIVACVKVHGATGANNYLATAETLTQQMIARFMINDNFYDSQITSKVFVTRPRDTTDNAYPAAASLATEALLMMSALFAKSEWRELAHRLISQSMKNIEAAPRFAAHSLCQLEAYLDGPAEVALVSKVDSELHKLIWQSPRAGLVMSVGETGESPLLTDRARINNQDTVFICQAHLCQAPLTDLVEIKKLLKIE